MYTTLKPLASLLKTVSFLELVYASAGIYQLLLAREERVAVAANIHFHSFAVFRRTRLERCATSTRNGYFVIIRMDVRFHYIFTSLFVFSFSHFSALYFSMLIYYTAFFNPRQLFLTQFAKNTCKFNENAVYLCYTTLARAVFTH